MGSTVMLLTSLWTSITLLLLQTSIVHTAAVPVVCQGTNYGLLTDLHGLTPDERITRLQTRYSGCELVVGNVEIVGLSSNADLRFFKDVSEITGYLLVYETQLVTVSLPSLMLIRGMQRFRDLETLKDAGLAVLNNSQLLELHMPQFTEISWGVVLFRNNPSICYIDTIRWDDILESSLNESLGFNVTAVGCDACNISCNGRCWGRDSESCQKPLSKVVCPKCTHLKKSSGRTRSIRCFNQSEDDCCNTECTAGCLLNKSPRACQFCQNFVDVTDVSPHGICRETDCQAGTVELSQFSLCNSSCNSPLIRSSTVGGGIDICSVSCPCDKVGSDCNFREYDEVKGECVAVSPPVRVCPGVETDGPILHKGNIDRFVDCAVVQGSIYIDEISLTGDLSTGIMPLSVADLMKLSTITEIEGYLAITSITHSNFSSLSFLPNLRAIRGRFSLFAGRYAVYIVGNSHLRFFRTTNLERVDRGDIRITDNEELCYVDSVNWTLIAQEPLTSDPSGIEVKNNQNRTICVQRGDVCDVECNGCWFTGPENCASCNNHEFQGICVAECNLQSDGTCGACLDVCTRFCNGPTGFDCRSDGPHGSECKYLIEGQQCVQTCSVGTYEFASNHSCLPCPSVCHIDPNPAAGSPIGCSGPYPFQRSGGCERCEKIGNVATKECIHEDDVCSNGTYDGTEPFRSGGSVPACVPCTTLCSLCTGAGLSDSTCQLCTRRFQEGECVDKCSSTHYDDPDGYLCQRCHPECLGCSGPLATDCGRCKNRQIRLIKTVTVSSTTGVGTTRQPATLTKSTTAVLSNSSLSLQVNVTEANATSCVGVNCSMVATTAPSSLSQVNVTEANATSCVGVNCSMVATTAPSPLSQVNVTDVNDTRCIGMNCSTMFPMLTTGTNSMLKTQAPPKSKTITLRNCIPTCPSSHNILDMEGYCVSSCSPGTFNDNNECRHCSPFCDESLGCMNDQPDSCDACKYFTLIYLDGITDCVDKCPDRFNVMIVNQSCVEFNATVPPTNDTSTPEPPKEEKASIIGQAVGGAVGGLVFIALLLIGIYLLHSHMTTPKGGVMAHMVELGQLSDGYMMDDAKQAVMTLATIEIKNLDIGDKLGIGCYGTAYKGYWSPPDQKVKIPVAIKILSESLSLRQEKELMQEAVKMAAVCDPNVLRLLGICMSDGVYLVTHFCPFGPLLGFLRRQKRMLTPMALITYSVQIAKAMEYLETKALVHGNLACRNILVQKPNQVRVTDYGLTNLVDKTAEGLPLAWMAPESIEMNIFTHQSDVWSFGVTLWELMTFGGVPYRKWIGQDLLAVLQKGERLRQPKTVTIEVYAVMLQCWIIEDSSRPCFEDMVKELDALRKDPARYILTAFADEAVPADRGTTMKSTYADTLAAGGDYDLEFDPDVQRALYEDPDAYEGFLEYEDPDNLKMPNCDGSKHMNGDVHGSKESVAGYENPAGADSVNDSDGPVVTSAPYETLRADQRERSQDYESPKRLHKTVEEDDLGDGYDHPQLTGLSSAMSGNSGTLSVNRSGGEVQHENERNLFDEAGYESVGPALEVLSRIGSKQEQNQFEKDTEPLREATPGYEDPSTLSKDTEEQALVISNDGAGKYSTMAASGQGVVSQPQVMTNGSVAEVDDMGTDQYEDPTNLI